jgi:8-oxo-dGTP diphosphatase
MGLGQARPPLTGAILLWPMQDATGRSSSSSGLFQPAGHSLALNAPSDTPNPGEADVNELLAKIWRMGKPLQWRFLWVVHAKFMCGITGVIRTEDGQVLLLRHRLWPEGRQWGFPTGYAKKSEKHEDTIAREVHEETGLTVKVGKLIKVNSGYKLRIEIFYEAVLIGGLDGLHLDGKEVIEARLFSPDALPAGMPEAHRELVKHV